MDSARGVHALRGDKNEIKLERVTRNKNRKEKVVAIGLQ